MHASVRTAAAALVLTTLSATAAFAQAPTTSATINVTATVQAPLVLTKQKDLTFGTTFQGISRDVLLTDAANSAQVDVAGMANAEVNLKFTNATALTCSSACSVTPTGPTTMTPTYTAAYSATNDRTTATAFVPSTGALPKLGAGSPALAVYLGGTVTPAVNQEPGNYTGTIRLDAQYTGN
jgi:hypothetical protein